MVVKILTTETYELGFAFWIHVLAVGPWKSHTTFLNFSFLIC